MNYIDSHAHMASILDENIMSEDEAKNLFKSGFGPIIDIGTKPEDLSARLSRLSSFPEIYFSAGIWPYKKEIERRHKSVALLEKNLSLVPKGRLIAIGETGLDHYHNDPADKDLMDGEQELFRLQIELARRHNLPVIVHSRDAAEETYKIIKENRDMRFLLHCFSYGVAETQKFLDLGVYISFSGVITYKNAHEQRKALHAVPLDRLLLETDAPFLAPTPHRGKKNRPDYIIETYKKAAEIKEIDEEILKVRIQENIKSFFGI